MGRTQIMNYKKQESELLDHQKQQREAFYTGVELYKTLDEINAKRIEVHRDQISMEDMLHIIKDVINNDCRIHQGEK